MCAALLNHAASSNHHQQQQHTNGPLRQKDSKKEKEKEKKLTVKPIRICQDKPRYSLKKTLKFEIQLEDVLPLETQVAGHGTEDQAAAHKHRGLLLHQDGFVLKPVQAPPKGEREMSFYQQISSSLLPVDTEMYALTPKFYGTERLRGAVHEGENAHHHNHYLVLEDLTQGMRRPCVMDIKIGAKTYGPDASPAKRRQEDGKYVGTKKPLGFSVLGIISREGADGRDTRRWDKTFGLSLATEEATSLLHNFFNWQEGGCGDGESAAGVQAAAKLTVVRHFHTLLVQVVDFFRHRQHRYHFYASSLLFLYDYDVICRITAQQQQQEAVIGCDTGDDGGGGIMPANYIRLKLIDFAHVFPAAGGCPDENFLFGVENLRDIFSRFLAEHGEYSSS